MRGQPSESQERFGGASLQPITRLLEKTQGWWIRWHEPLGTNVHQDLPSHSNMQVPRPLADLYLSGICTQHSLFPG